MHWNRFPTGDKIRVAGYVCYEPRSHATPEQIARKAEVFEKRLVATHVRCTYILNRIAESSDLILAGEGTKGLTYSGHA